MPQNRKRVSAPGAKAVGVRTKFKIGNRKSGRGAKQLSAAEVLELLEKVSKKDRNMLRRMLEARGMVSLAEPVEA